MNSVQKRAPRLRRDESLRASRSARPRGSDSPTLRARWGDKEGRRREILSAARELLDASDYSELSMRVLADRAGISAGTLYLYFRTKEEIFLTIYCERIEALREEGRRASAKAKSLK